MKTFDEIDELFQQYSDLYFAEFNHRPLSHRADWLNKPDELERAIKSLSSLCEMARANNSTLNANTGPVTGNTPRMGSLVDDLLNDEDLSDIGEF